MSLYNSHVLLKFISKKEYVEDFLDGNLYMNSLYNLRGEKPVEDARMKKEAYLKAHPEVNPDSIAIPIQRTLSHGAEDILEGSIGYGSNISFNDKNFEEHLLSDPIFRAVGFQYCNVLCFYRLDYTYRRSHGETSIFYKIPCKKMSEFGEYVVIIKNKKKLLKRISRALKDMKYLYLCGNVDYEAPIKNGREVDFSEQGHLLLKADTTIDIKNVQFRPNELDCFSKTDNYDWQKEWRVALYRGKKDTSVFRLNIGDIKDIATYTKVKNLATTLDSIFIAKDIKRNTDGYFGNITREEMQEKFLQLGDNKTEMFTFIG